jgi:hypothetical protein
MADKEEELANGVAKLSRKDQEIVKDLTEKFDSNDIYESLDAHMKKHKKNKLEFYQQHRLLGIGDQDDDEEEKQIEGKVELEFPPLNSIENKSISEVLGILLDPPVTGITKRREAVLRIIQSYILLSLKAFFLGL